MCKNMDCIDCPGLAICDNVSEDARRFQTLHEIRVMFAELEYTRRTNLIREIRELFETTIYAVPPKPLYDESEEKMRMFFSDLRMRHFNLYNAQYC